MHRWNFHRRSPLGVLRRGSRVKRDHTRNPDSLKPDKVYPGKLNRGNRSQWGEKLSLEARLGKARQRLTKGWAGSA